MSRGGGKWLVVGPLRGPHHEALRVARRLASFDHEVRAFDPEPSRDPRWDLLDLLWDGCFDGVLILETARLSAMLLEEFQAWGLRVALVASPRVVGERARWQWLLRAASLRAVTTSVLAHQARDAGIPDITVLSPSCWMARRSDRRATGDQVILVVAGNRPSRRDRHALDALRGLGPVRWLFADDPAAGTPESVDHLIGAARLVIDADQARGVGGVIDLSSPEPAVTGLRGLGGDQSVGWASDLVAGAARVLKTRAGGGRTREDPGCLAGFEGAPGRPGPGGHSDGDAVDPLECWLAGPRT